MTLLKREGIQLASYCSISDLSNFGGVSDDRRKIILYEDMLNSLSEGSRLLIQGRPGSGKSTLIHKISKDWACGKVTLKHIRAILLVHLGNFSSNCNLKLKDILEDYYSCKSTLDDITMYAEKHSGLGLCFMLDGLDCMSKTNDAFILKLIKKQALPKAIVLATSSPAAATHLLYQKVATIRVEVIGFLKDQIHDFVENYPFLKESKRKDLYKYFDQHPNIHHMCYLPIHAATVCFLFNILDTGLPETETEVYRLLTKHTILRNQYRYDVTDILYVLN